MPSQQDNYSEICWNKEVGKYLSLVTDEGVLSRELDKALMNASLMLLAWK